MPEIIPAILPKSFTELTLGLEQVAGLVPYVQIDILDGKFTPERTWPNIGAPDPDFVKIIREEEGFPLWDEIDFEVDLMVADPEEEFQRWVSAGAKRLIPHFESFKTPETAKAFAEKFQSQYGGDGSFLALELGMAINIDTPIEVLEPLIEHIQFVQCMGIAKIGYQKQPFDERVLEKVKSIREKYPELTISIDGGVNLETAPKLLDAGADRLVVGSAIYETDDIANTIEEFKNL